MDMLADAFIVVLAMVGFAFIAPHMKWGD